MSATRWGRVGAVAGKVRVTSCQCCAVLRSRGVCQDVCHTVGEGWGSGEESMSDVMSMACGIEISRGFVTMSATRSGRGGAVAEKVRVTSCQCCAVLRSRGVCHNVCHTVGEGWGCGGESTSDVMSMLCGIEISRGLSQCLPHGRGGVGLWRGKYE